MAAGLDRLGLWGSTVGERPEQAAALFDKALRIADDAETQRRKVRRDGATQPGTGSEPRSEQSDADAEPVVSHKQAAQPGEEEPTTRPAGASHEKEVELSEEAQPGEEESATGATGLGTLALVHAGIAAAQLGSPARGAELIERALRMDRDGRWVLSAAQRGQMEAALEDCRRQLGS